MIALARNFDWSFTDTKKLSDDKKKQMKEMIKTLNNQYKL